MSSINESPTREDHVDKRPRRKASKSGMRSKRLRSKGNLNISGIGGSKYLSFIYFVFNEHIYLVKSKINNFKPWPKEFPKDMYKYKS